MRFHGAQHTPRSQVLEIKDVAVEDAMDLGEWAMCAPRLERVLFSEAWGVGPVQVRGPPIHEPGLAWMLV